MSPPAALATIPAVGTPLVDRSLFGVYVHVPFCRTRGHDSDFETYTGLEQSHIHI
jgi:coproporphyrinogen III oxidase-like Fe-S oxidoreductase